MEVLFFCGDANWLTLPELLEGRLLGLSVFLVDVRLTETLSERSCDCFLGFLTFGDMSLIPTWIDRDSPHKFGVRMKGRWFQSINHREKAYHRGNRVPSSV